VFLCLRLSTCASLRRGALSAFCSFVLFGCFLFPSHHPIARDVMLSVNCIFGV